MPDSPLRTTALAVAAVAAVALAASVLDAATLAEHAALGGRGSGSPGGVTGHGDLDIQGSGTLFPWWVPVLVLAVVAAVLLFALFFERRRFVAYTATLFAAVLLLFALFYAVSEFAGGGAPQAAANQTNASTPGSGGGVNPARPVGPTLPVVLVATLLAGGLLAAALAVRVAGSDDDADPTSVPDPGLGAAAGRAADRIEHASGDAELDNAVYRAFHDLTARLDVPNPDSATPADFARVAVDAGMDADDVATVTDLFRAVRYGDREPTEAMEDDAVAAFRRIEERQGEGRP